MEPDNLEKSRNALGRWTKGHSGNVLGRPKGKTMKEWAKEYLSRMTDEERDEFMDGMPKEIIWKMSEGNPETKTDVTSGGKPIPILGIKHVPTDDNNPEDIKTNKEN